MIKLKSILLQFFLAIFMPSTMLMAADDLPTKIGKLHTALVTLKTKLETVDRGLESIYEQLNPGGPSLFVAQFIKKLVSPIFDDLTVESNVQNYDNTLGKFTASITYQLDNATKTEIEFLHNRDARQGSITIQFSGTNQYARWEKISDYANSIVTLINGGGLMSLESDGVTFIWQFQEKKWYSRQLDLFIQIVVNLAQATNGLAQKITDPGTNKEILVPGTVIINQKKAFELIKKTILESQAKAAFKNQVLNYSLHGQRYHDYLLQALDLIPQGDAGDNDWQKVLKIIKRFFKDHDYAFESDLFYFKASHAPSLVGIDEEKIVNYDALSEHDLIMYDQDPAQDFVKKIAKVSSFRGGLIQSIIGRIITKKFYEQMSQKTLERLLKLIEQHAEFFANCGTWEKGKLGVNKELKYLLQAPRISALGAKVEHINQAIGYFGYLSSPDSLQKKNADYFLSGTLLPESLFEKLLSQHFQRILSEKNALEAIKLAYQSFPEIVRAVSEEQLAIGVMQSDQTIRNNSTEIIGFLQQEDVTFRSRVISTGVLKKTENFAWINKSKNQWIGGMAKPKSGLHLEMLKSLNVGLLVSLQKVDFTKSPIQDPELENLYLPVPDFSIPTVEQVNQFIQRADFFHAQGKRVIVHCTAGIGRTGTLLACWFVAKKNMTAQQAIIAVRKFRPGSIETEKQMQFISDYYDSVHGS